MASIRERARQDGAVVYAVLYRLDGRQTSITWPDKKQAEKFCSLVDNLGPRKAMEVAGQPDTRRAQPGGFTVERWLAHYIDHLTGISKSTRYDYRSYLRTSIAPVLGHIPLARLGSDHVSAWVQAMQDAGAASKTISNKQRFFSSALNAAVKAGHINSNPAAGARPPSTERKEMMFLTREEFAQLLAEVDEWWRPVVEFLVASGARFGEVTALRPPDVDRTAETVRISRAWKRTYEQGRRWETGPPKTTKSRRTINVVHAVLDKLDYSGEWLFTNRSGGPVRPDYFRKSVWLPAVERAQLSRPPRIHDLRHTCASWLIAAGLPLPAIQDHLGHESIEMTVGIYGHLDRRSGQAVAAAIGNLLGE